MIYLSPMNCTKAVLYSTSGSQTAELCYRNDTMIVFFFAADKNEDYLNCFAFF